ncbi:Alpha/Beta hydrolase protein, partial [Mortierella sp. GBAus27b]
SQDAAFNVLLPIKKHGTRDPLFCVHSGSGLNWDYLRVVKHLDVDQPVYGLQIRGFFDDNQPAATVDDMARDYIDQIRKIQPHGPYRLLGWSFGGFVAHSIASHLERQGEKVVLLGLMDSFPFAVERATEPSAQVNRTEYIRRLLGKGDDDTDEVLTKQELAFWKKAPEVGPWVVRLLTNHSVPRYSGDMILFQATIQTDPTIPLISASDWEPYVEGEIEVHEINCAHYDMMEVTPITEIGRILDQRLQEIHTSNMKEE